MKTSGNALLLAGSIVLTLIAAEGALALFGLPRERKAATRDPQFTAVRDAEFGYANAPNAAIRFTYDDNPRGYFGPENEIVHHTNSHGFRGPAFEMRKAPGTIRHVFLGDSFTFGEGVKDGDTFVAKFQALVAGGTAQPGQAAVEALNLGVGGFNTEQEAALLRQFAVFLSPDRVFVMYCLNDAEPVLYERTADGRITRRQRGAEVPEYAGTPEVPAPWSASRLTRLAWLAVRGPIDSRRTVAHYRALYDEASPGWDRARKSLAEIGRISRERGITATVAVLPVLYRLDGDYPFAEAHQMVCRAAASAGMRCVHLLPTFAGHSGRDLWVHPTDQHPNEQAHALIAESLAAFVREGS